MVATHSVHGRCSTAGGQRRARVGSQRTTPTVWFRTLVAGFPHRGRPHRTRKCIQHAVTSCADNPPVRLRNAGNANLARGMQGGATARVTPQDRAEGCSGGFSCPSRGKRSKEALCAAQAVGVRIPKGGSFVMNVACRSRTGAQSVGRRIPCWPSSAGPVALP